MTIALAPDVSRWTVAEIEDLVLVLLGGLLHEDPRELRVRLLGQGLSMPIDSLDLFDVLQEFRQATGLTVPVRKLGRQTMRSVSSFARFVAEQAAS